MLDRIPRANIQCTCRHCGREFTRPAIRPGVSVWETQQYLTQDCKVCDECHDREVTMACGIKKPMHWHKRRKR